MALETLGILLSVMTVTLVIRRGYPLFWAMLWGTAVIVLFSRLGIPEVGRVVHESVTNPVTLLMVEMVMGITVLGYALDKTGLMQKMVNSLKSLVRSSRLLMILLPASVSILAVPGGAVLSAPMVETAAEESSLDITGLSVINMIFRHLFTIISPFYPAIILISGITGISMSRFILFNLSITVTGLILANYVLFRNVHLPAVEKNAQGAGEKLRELLLSFLPFAVIVVLYVGLGLYLPLSILAGIVITLLLNAPEGATLRQVFLQRVGYLWRGINWKMALTIFTVLLYKDFVGQADSISELVGTVLSGGFPLTVLLVVLPYLTGIMTGNNAASLGITLPILMPFLGIGTSLMGQLGIIFVSSYAGYLGSPVHLCTYLTCEYFESPLGQVVLRLNMFGMAFIACSLVVSRFF